MSSHMIRGKRVIFGPSWTVEKKKEYLRTVDVEGAWEEDYWKRLPHIWLCQEGGGIHGLETNPRWPYIDRRWIIR